MACSAGLAGLASQPAGMLKGSLVGSGGPMAALLSKLARALVLAEVAEAARASMGARASKVPPLHSKIGTQGVKR